MSGDLQVKPIKDPSKLEVRQSPTPHLPRLPTRALVLANSGGGGTTLLVNLLTRKSLYGDAFSSIFVWSQSVNIDTTWAPLKEQCRKRGQKVEEHFFSEWNGGKDIE